MPYPTLTFTNLLADYCEIATVPRDGTTGNHTPTEGDKAECASLLNRACAFIWQDWHPTIFLPCMTATATVTPDATTKIVAAATLDYASKWSFWTSDPRPVHASGRTAWETTLRRATQETDGPMILDPSTTMFAFYQTRAPRFTHTAWATSTAYAVGDVVLQSGSCYRCLTQHTAGTFATDLSNAKWREQTVPEELRAALLRRVAELRAGDVTERLAKSQDQGMRAEALMEAIYSRALHTLAVWQFTNGGLSPVV